MFRHYYGIGIEDYRQWEWKRFELHKDYIKRVLNKNEGGG